MDGFFVFLAVLAFALTLLFVWLRRKASRDRELMAATPTSKAAEVAALAPGTLVELKGMLRCTAPLRGEFSGQSCVYYKADTIEERTEYRSNSDGRRERHHSTHLVSSNCRTAPCVVEDESGRVALHIEGATVEGDQVLNRTEPAVGGVLGAVGNLVTGGHTERRYIETILAHDIPVYVLGEVQPDHSVGKPRSGSKNSSFVVSKRSEEQRSDELAGSVTLYYWLAIGCAALGAGLLVWARVKGAG